MIIDHTLFSLLLDEAGEGDAGGGGDAGAAGGGDPAPIPGDVEVIPLPEEPEETAEVDPTSPGAQRAAELAGATTQTRGSDSAFQPNFKYKVNDAEKDLPDWVRSLVTDAESEKNVRELFERSEGLDAVKASREAVGRERDEIRGHFTQQSQAIQSLTGLLQRGYKGDVHAVQSFFEALQIPEEFLLRYAAHRAHTLSNPDLATQHDAARRAYFEQNGLAGERDYYRNEAIRAASVQRGAELDIAMARPEVMAAAKSFDTRMGTVGAFRTHVIRAGQSHAALNKGADLPVMDAIQNVIKLAGLEGGAQPAPTTGAAGSPQALGTGGQPPNGAPRQAPPKKPVIPNIAGSGASPVAIVPKSIKQLREMGQRAAAEGR